MRTYKYTEDKDGRGRIGINKKIVSKIMGWKSGDEIIHSPSSKHHLVIENLDKIKRDSNNGKLDSKTIIAHKDLWIEQLRRMGEVTLHKKPTFLKTRKITEPIRESIWFYKNRRQEDGEKIKELQKIKKDVIKQNKPKGSKHKRSK